MGSRDDRNPVVHTLNLGQMPTFFSCGMKYIIQNNNTPIAAMWYTPIPAQADVIIKLITSGALRT